LTGMSEAGWLGELVRSSAEGPQRPTIDDQIEKERAAEMAGYLYLCILCNCSAKGKGSGFGSRGGALAGAGVGQIIGGSADCLGLSALVVAYPYWTYPLAPITKRIFRMSSMSHFMSPTIPCRSRKAIRSDCPYSTVPETTAMG
jgi:hypothetical protein